MMRHAKALAVSLTFALIVTWLGAYVISPMHWLLAAPAWGFVYLFGELLRLRPSIANHVALETVSALATATNLIAWWFVAFGLFTVAAHLRARRPSV